MDQELEQMLRFIRGETQPYGTGIRTNPRLKRHIHNLCLELEKMGLIYRSLEYSGFIYWEPKEVKEPKKGPIKQGPPRKRIISGATMGKPTLGIKER